MAVLWCGLLATGATGHVFVFEEFRVGAFPDYEGSGWRAEAYFIPDESAAHLLTAEAYAASHEPDFTFRTEWIDFPAGPVAERDDADFATVGDFLNDYVFDVSDPAKLDEPFGHLLIRFDGLLRVALEDNVSRDDTGALPVWVETGSFGHDAYRVRVVDTIFRIPIIVNNNPPFKHENAIVLGTGLFPIQVTYFNRFDPGNADGLGRAGFELYSWHGGGLPWPEGNRLVHFERGPATILPPRVIYQPEDILPVIKGDYEADFDVDLRDFGFFQYCFTGPDDTGVGLILRVGCNAFDFDDDLDVDFDDLAAFQAATRRCQSADECGSPSTCEKPVCLQQTCATVPALYGDVDRNDTINIFDLFCVLDAFSDVFERCTFSGVDIEPCLGNGAVNVFDLFALLDALDGVDPCCGGG